MREKSWPAATKRSVEKVAADLKKLAGAHKVLSKRLDTMQATAAASALVDAVRDVAAAIREGGGGDVAQLRQEMADTMDKITAFTLENTAALAGGTDGSEETKA